MTPHANAFRRLLLASVALVGGMACAGAAQAQAESGAAVDAIAVDVGEVVVTARRTEERAQDVPITLSVVGGEALEQAGAYTLADVQNQVPSLVAFNSNPRNSAVGIRGIGVSTASDGLDASVGVYVDGVYLGRPGMALTDLIDIDRVEVLRGPQGTLFGRNTSAGVLNITTRRPTFDPGLTAEASIGDYSYNQLRLSLNGPLIDGKLAGRLTVFNTHRDGVLDNVVTHIAGNSIGRSGVRGQLLFTPTSDIDVRLIAEYAQEDDTCCVSVLHTVLPASTSATVARTLTAFKTLGYTPVADHSVSRNNAPQNMRTDTRAVSAEVNWDLGFADLTSITAWRYWHFDPLQDSDGTTLDIIQVNAAQTRDWQWSQELRLASKPGRLTWQAGLYWFQQKLKDHFILNQFGSDAGAFYTAYNRLSNPSAPVVNIAPGSQYIGDTRADSESWAVFGQADYEITDRLTATAGLRYTHDERHGITVTSTRGTPYLPTSIPFNYDVEVSGGEWSYLASLAYKVTDDVLAYGSYSTGHKAAGLNLNAAVTPGSPLILEPETVENWELGLKSTLFGRATLNLSAFWADLSGLQANISPSNGARQYLANVGDIRSKGVELDGSWRATQGLTLSGSVSYNDVTYADYRNAPCPVGVAAPCDLTGQRVFQAPEWVANLQARYEFDWRDDIHPYVQAQYSYRSEVYGQVDASPYSLIEGYSVVNARVGASFGDGRYDVSVWANNLLDEEYFNTLGSSSIVGASVYGFSGQLGAPRTIGATLRAEF
ncbi:MAG TPA: TonB-dependent receptor [Phenylobacterium sp.]